MAWFRDIDRLTPFIMAFKPRLANELDGHVEETYNAMVSNWEDGQNALGEPWVPNAPETIRQKNGSTPLIDERDMIESATYNVDRDNLEGRIIIRDEDGKVLAHENGVPEMGIPPRPILGPAMQHFEQNTDSLLDKVFRKSWMDAQTAGTTMHASIGGNN